MLNLGQIESLAYLRYKTQNHKPFVTAFAQTSGRSGCILVVSNVSRRVKGESIFGIRLANIVIPAPEGPTKNMIRQTHSVNIFVGFSYIEIHQSTLANN